jgi:hypothetical protein
VHCWQTLSIQTTPFTDNKIISGIYSESEPTKSENTALSQDKPPSNSAASADKSGNKTSASSSPYAKTG